MKSGRNEGWGMIPPATRGSNIAIRTLKDPLQSVCWQELIMNAARPSSVALTAAMVYLIGCSVGRRRSHNSRGLQVSGSPTQNKRLEDAYWRVGRAQSAISKVA